MIKAHAKASWRGKLRTALAVGAVTASVGLVPLAADAAAGTATTAGGARTTGTASAQVAAAGKNFTFLEFDKGASPTNSRLKFVFVQNTNPDHVRAWVIDSWRAGSGDGSKNSCLKFHGWLPNGTYKILKYFPHHNGGPKGVNGIAWQLSDGHCSKHVKRDELFIHSKMRPSGAQGTGPYKWTNSYISNGCIKLNPKDIRSLQSLWNSYPHPGNLYVR